MSKATQLGVAAVGIIVAATVIANLTHQAPPPKPAPTGPPTRADISTASSTIPTPPRDGVWHVRSGDDIQNVLDAASQSEHKIIHVHEGTYRPRHQAQALLVWNRQHDGIQLLAQGEVIFTAANPALGDENTPGYPAAVNHVLYFGDGISSKTLVTGFTITGANGFVGTDETLKPIEKDNLAPNLEKGLFFFADGGAIKVFGRSAPTLEDLVVKDNRTLLCGAGVSVEQRGYQEAPVVMRNIQFLNNHCPGTGSAVDVLGDSAAVLENCLFVNNIANTGMDEIAKEYNLRYNPEHGCGALTVFPKSKVQVRRCTFTGNWNGADDKGSGSSYEDCIFWDNTAGDGSRPGAPYEIDIVDASRVNNCFFGGNPLIDLRKSLDPNANHLNAPNPEFDDSYVPQHPDYAAAGYRPAR